FLSIHYKYTLLHSLLRLWFHNMPWSVSSETLENGYLARKMANENYNRENTKDMELFQCKTLSQNLIFNPFWVFKIREKKKKNLVLVAFRVSTPTTHHPKTTKQTTYIQRL
ncbi:hypothetical protein PanWU01x14_111230, partial [Parasponia andersonii]